MRLSICDFTSKPPSMTQNEELAEALQRLITTNYDAERGYKESAEDVDDARLKSWFREYAQQRYQFGHELKAEMNLTGEAPEKGTSVSADLHRMWIDIKSAISNNDEAAVLREVIRGEESALKTYDEVLEHNALPMSTRSIISRHRTQIAAAIEKVKQLQAEFSGSH